jgi:hypothetical protein
VTKCQNKTADSCNYCTTAVFAQQFHYTEQLPQCQCELLAGSMVVPVETIKAENV